MDLMFSTFLFQQQCMLYSRESMPSLCMTFHLFIAMMKLKNVTQFAKIFRIRARFSATFTCILLNNTVPLLC